MAAGSASPTSVPLQPPSMLVSDSFAKDAILAWYRGEFVAANTIIDVLCAHLAQLSSSAEYQSVFAAIHRRRLHWIPVLQMQKYHSISSVILVEDHEEDDSPIGAIEPNRCFGFERQRKAILRGEDS